MKKALSDYLASPNFCESCKQPILPQVGQKLSEVKGKRFCNRSCSTTFNNIRNPKRNGKASYRCQACQEEVSFRRNSKGKKKRRRYCDRCAFRAKFGISEIAQRTKGELFATRSDWQSARSSIRFHAQTVFKVSGQPLLCQVCGYSIHVNISHVRSVSSFPDDALIAEVNHLANLVALCPNHHWEFDHKLLVLP